MRMYVFYFNGKRGLGGLAGLCMLLTTEKSTHRVACSKSYFLLVQLSHATPTLHPILSFTNLSHTAQYAQHMLQTRITSKPFLI